jgi:hypothetical protein
LISQLRFNTAIILVEISGHLFGLVLTIEVRNQRFDRLLPLKLHIKRLVTQLQCFLGGGIETISCDCLLLTSY